MYYKESISNFRSSLSTKPDFRYCITYISPRTLIEFHMHTNDGDLFDDIRDENKSWTQRELQHLKSYIKTWVRNDKQEQVKRRVKEFMDRSSRW